MSNSGVPIVEDVAGGVGDVVDTVEEAVNDVGDAISDVGEWLDDEVIQPVVDVTKDVLSNELVVTVASIAATATGNAWAVPLIQGASVAAQGGDIRDVLEASAKAYVASQVGAKVGSGVGSSVASSTGSQVAGSIIGQGTGSAVVAAAMGGDPVQAFITGGAMASVPHIMGQSDYFAGISDKMKDGTASAGEIATYKAAQTLVTSAVTGKEVDEKMVATMAASSYMGGELLKEIDPNNEFSEAESALVMDMVNSSMQAYVAGGNIQDAVMKDIVRYGNRELKTALKDGFASFKNTASKYETLQSKASEIEANTAQRTAALEKYQQYENEYETELALLTEKQQQAQAAYDGVEAGTMTIADAEEIINDYNDEAALFEARINDYYNPNLETTADEYAQYEEVFTDLTEDYNTLMEDFQTEADKIDEELAPAYDSLKQAFVKGMDPNFDPEEYAEVNGISTVDAEGNEVDMYDHWLSEGQYQGLATNVDSAATIEEINKDLVGAEKQRIFEEAISGQGILGRSAVTADSAKNFFKELDNAYGNDVSALKDIKGSDFNNSTYFKLEENPTLAALDGTWDVNTMRGAIQTTLPQAVQNVIDGYSNGQYSLGEAEDELNALGYDIDLPDQSSDADVTITIPNTLEGKVRPIGEATSRGYAVNGRVITDPTTGEVKFVGDSTTSETQVWNPNTGQLETVKGEQRDPITIQDEIKKDPFTWLTSLSQAEEDMRTAIQEATGLNDYFFDVSKNAINIAKSTNNDAPVKQVTDIFKTGDEDAIQNYNNIISKDATTWGGTYTPSDEDVVNVLNSINANPDLDSQTAIQQYVDPRYIDVDEVKEAASQQGYEISDEEALKYVGQFNESEILPTYQETFDPLATTEEEARDFFSRYRYDPTDEEVQQFISGTLGEEEQRRAIGSYVIPGFGDIQSDISGISDEVSGLKDTIGGIGGQVGGLEEGLGQLGQGVGEGIGGVLGMVTGMGRDLRRQTQTNTLLSLLNAGSGGTQQQEVKSVDPAKIGYMYDIGGESIFATPQQERMFVTPYAQGGQVQDSTEALLRLLEGK